MSFTFETAWNFDLEVVKGSSLSISSPVSQLHEITTTNQLQPFHNVYDMLP